MFQRTILDEAKESNYFYKFKIDPSLKTFIYLHSVWRVLIKDAVYTLQNVVRLNKGLTPFVFYNFRYSSSSYLLVVVKRKTLSCDLIIN